MREADKSIHQAPIGCGVSRTPILGHGVHPCIALVSPAHRPLNQVRSMVRMIVRITGRSSQGEGSWRAPDGKFGRRDTSNYEMILASKNAAAAAKPPITMVWVALRNGPVPVKRPLR